MKAVAILSLALALPSTAWAAPDLPLGAPGPSEPALAARGSRLNERGEDPAARARIETLMNRIDARDRRAMNSICAGCNSRGMRPAHRRDAAAGAVGPTPDDIVPDDDAVHVGGTQP